jgi:hypothetical protein
MRRTTIIADEELMLEAKHLAQRESKSFSALVQDALREYIAGHRPKRHISFIGIGESDGSPLSVEEQDRMLRDGLDPIEGWSPDRSGSRRAAKAPTSSQSRP